MIVVSERRAGGTKFCLDLAKEKGLTFVAETSDRSVEELKYMRMYNDSMNGKHPKAIYHETNFADYYDFEELVDKIENHDDYVFLHNEFVTPVGFKDADIFLMRESPRDGCISVINFVIGNALKNNDIAKDEILVHTSILLRDQICQTYMMTRYCLMHDIEPVFYEKMDWSKPVNSTLIDQSIYRNEIYTSIDSHLNMTDLDFYRTMLLTKYKK